MTPEFGNLAEIISVVIETQGRMDTSWALFLSINSAIIRGVVLIERVFNILEKSVAIIVYTFLTALSFLITNNSVKQLHALYLDITKIKYAPDEAGHEIVSYFSSIITGDVIWASPLLIPGIYLGAYILTISCIIFDEKFTFTEQKAKPKKS